MGKYTTYVCLASRPLGPLAPWPPGPLAPWPPEPLAPSPLAPYSGSIGLNSMFSLVNYRIYVI